MDLMQVAKGEYATVIRVKTEEKIRMRLKTFGVYPGIRVKVLRRSLFSGNILLEIGGAQIGVSKEIAEQISVMKIGS